MTKRVAMERTKVSPSERVGSYRALRVSCWGIAISLGAAHAWATRFEMYPDGVSYLDIGDAYWRGDWHHAINPYWSPLYSWILGFFLKVSKPSMYWEYPVAHLVNFLIYVASLTCFDFFLETFIAERRRRDLELRKYGQAGLGEGSWYVLAYSLFVSSSIVLVGLQLVMPDLLVAAVVYLASAFLIRIAVRSVSTWNYAELGAVLGIGYLSKSVMLPLGVVFLFTALILDRFKCRKVALAALVFVLICAPFIFAISIHKGRPTIGESGRWNYLVFVDGVKPFLPQAGPPLERPMRLAELPSVYDYSRPFQATYPPWLDPSYWQDGINPHLDPKRQLGITVGNLWFCSRLLTDTYLQSGYAIGFLILAFIFSIPPRLSSDLSWYLLLPAGSALTLFCLLLLRYRYVAPFVLVVWLILFAALRFPVSSERGRLIRFVVICTCAVAMISPVLGVVMALNQQLPPIYSQAAAALRSDGIESGDAVAIIWNEDWDLDAFKGSFVPRLLKARVVGEAEPAQAFWSQPEENQSKVIAALFRIGAKAVIARKPTAGSGVIPCWRELDRSGFYACLPDTKAP